MAPIIFWAFSGGTSYAYNLLLPMLICLAATWLLSCWHNTTGAAVLLLSLVSLGLSYLPAASYRITDQWNGVYQDYHTYDDQPAGLEESTADFTVTSYDLSLSFGRYMQVEGKLHISAQEPRSQFIFTLYRGYEISALTGETCSVTWSTAGDTVTVCTDTPITELDLHIAYSGSHSIFFSYAEGVTLPGWFPWYPMAGEQQVFLNFETLASGYNTFNRIAAAQITLRTDASFPVVSNPEETKNGVFSSSSDSITIIGGNLLLCNGQAADCLPLELTESADSWSAALSQQWQTLCSELKDYGIPLPCDRDCKMIIASRDLCRLYPLNELALFGDYILTWSDGLSMQNLSTQIFLSQNADSKLAGRICGYGSLADTPAETLENWLNYLTMAEDNDSFSQLLKRTLEAAKTAGQGEEAVKEIARFLCTPNAVESEGAFLEGMCIQYASNS